MNVNFRRLRQLHQKLAPIVILPLMVTATTGIAYRLGREWFGLSRDRAHFLMAIHEGEYLGELRPVYVLLNGMGLLFMLGTGISLWVQSMKKAGWFSWGGSKDQKKATTTGGD